MAKVQLSVNVGLLQGCPGVSPFVGGGYPCPFGGCSKW